MPARADDATDKAAFAAGSRMSIDAPGRPGDATPNPVQTNAMAASAASEAMSSIPPDATLPPDDASEASDASVETVSSSNCDPQSPEEAPVIAAPDLAAVLAAQDVTDVLLADLNAPLVTIISLEEKALAPLAPLLRVPYLERLPEVVRDGTPLDRLQDALRPAVIQAHDDLATFLTELVLELFDGEQLRGLQGQLQPFRGLADPLTVRRAVLAQMRYVADVASSLPSNAHSTSGGLFRLAWRTCKGRALTLRLRTVFIFVPQPVAACLRVPSAARRRPELANILLPEHPPSACSYLAAKWQFDVSHTPSASFTSWYMTRRRLTCGPLLLEACRQGCVPVNILDHLQIPQFRLVAQIRLPVLGAPGKRPLPADTMLADLHRLGWRTALVLQMPRERAQPLGAEIPLALRQPHDIRPPGVSPLVEDADVALSLHFYFLTARIPLAAAQVQHLGSPERLAFGSAPIPRVAKKRPRHSVPFSLADLITRLRQTGPPCLMLALWPPLPP